MAVLLETTIGDIVIDLYPEERPRCCLNFLKLCKIKYYNFCLFHSVQPKFMVQTGDPTSTGRGGEAVFSKLYGDQAKFFEMETNPRIKHKKRGCVSMVNNGENLHGSQFFITLREDIDYLDGQHTVFGEVSEGFDILDKFNEVITDKQNRPYQDIRINHTVILDDPFDDPKGLEIPDRSPEPSQDLLKSDRIAPDEEIDDMKGRSKEEVEELEKTQEAKANAQILEMIGDLPDADVKPPENVLFVCQLNPVTTSEDLEIIFSRFGKLVSCEVIKDKATGNSLQYAFVEFEREEDCEQAYFKMDNVLIDDRRIHVDFSQSVAKLQHKGRGPVMPQVPRRNGGKSDGGRQQGRSTDNRSQDRDRKHNKYNRKSQNSSSDGGSSDSDVPRKGLRNETLKSSRAHHSTRDNHDEKRDRTSEASRVRYRSEKNAHSSSYDRSSVRSDRDKHYSEMRRRGRSPASSSDGDKRDSRRDKKRSKESEEIDRRIGKDERRDSPRKGEHEARSEKDPVDLRSSDENKSRNRRERKKRKETKQDRKDSTSSDGSSEEDERRDNHRNNKKRKERRKIESFSSEDQTSRRRKSKKDQKWREDSSDADSASDSEIKWRSKKKDPEGTKRSENRSEHSRNRTREKQKENKDGRSSKRQDSSESSSDDEVRRKKRQKCDSSDADSDFESRRRKSKKENKHVRNKGYGSSGSDLEMGSRDHGQKKQKRVRKSDENELPDSDNVSRKQKERKSRDKEGNKESGKSRKYDHKSENYRSKEKSKYDRR